MKNTEYILLVLAFCGVQAFAQTTPKGILRPERPSTQKLVSAKLSFAIQPESQSVCLGDGVRFVAGVEGSGVSPTFQWEGSTDKGETWSDITGANFPYYDEIKRVSTAHHGLMFRLRVEAGAEKILSRSATLYVQDMMDLEGVLKNQVAVEGGAVLFEFEEKTIDLPDKAFFQWQKSEYGTAVWENLRGENQMLLSLSNIDYKENGTLYRFFIYGEGLCDTVFSAPALLSVLKTPVVSVTPGKSAFCGGGTATFSVRMTGASGLEKIQWQRSQNEGVSFLDIEGATQLSYFLPELKPSMTGDRYRVVLLLPGEVRMPTHEAIITVYGAVSFSEKPQSQAVCYGDEGIFRIKAESEGETPTYQWQVDKSGQGDWQNIEGAESEEYRIRTDQNDANGWRFRALVYAGGCNSIETEPAKLQVLTTLKFIRQPKNFRMALPDDDAVFLADFDGRTTDFTISWQWSATDGATWQDLPKSSGLSLRIPRVQPEMAGYIYRLRVMNKKCGRIFYSDPARIIFPEGGF